MNSKLTFSFGHFKQETPKFVHWISVSGAGLLTLMAGLNVQYPLYVSEHMIAETAKALAAFRLIAQFLGYKAEVATPTPEKPTNENADTATNNG